MSTVSGRREVYVTTLPSGESSIQISTEGGSSPRWRDDGEEIYYVAPGGTVMSVALRVGADLDADRPSALFQVPNLAADFGYQYDVTGNGERFLLNIQVEPEAPPPITVVVNWTAELAR